MTGRFGLYCTSRERSATRNPAEFRYNDSNAPSRSRGEGGPVNAEIEVEAARPLPGDRRSASPTAGLVRFVCHHWLAAANAILLVFASLPFAAPVLAANGFDRIAVALYQAYALTCHQMPSRSFFILGQQMAYCERNTAIYLSMALAGLVYARFRSRGVRPLPWRWYALLILPMAIDGFSQLFGWRESTWFLRVITGTLFGAATIWLCFPYLQPSFDEIEREL